MRPESVHPPRAQMHFHFSPRLVRRWIFQDISISTSDQISGSIYSSGLVSIGIGAMPQTLEIGADNIEPAGSQIPIQVPSSHISIGDGPQTLKMTAFLQSLVLWPATDGTFQLCKRTWKCCTSY
ncbi:uncharacterized protein LOC121770526 isoform X2 [Salvia splendens]|uniref:uncharacterized protein LOC121770526 isoform X2 n=1 Tax=Salvia splendens TaxID=180675 RepID=UPI001C25C588|nr:uncharacterized protein LOC121770526 isoform X2 [Salvia splendens]